MIEFIYQSVDLIKIGLVLVPQAPKVDFFEEKMTFFGKFRRDDGNKVSLSSK